jgi:hypothetical protein
MHKLIVAALALAIATPAEATIITGTFEDFTGKIVTTNPNEAYIPFGEPWEQIASTPGAYRWAFKRPVDLGQWLGNGAPSFTDLEAWAGGQLVPVGSVPDFYKINDHNSGQYYPQQPTIIGQVYEVTLGYLDGPVVLWEYTSPQPLLSFDQPCDGQADAWNPLICPNSYQAFDFAPPPKKVPEPSALPLFVTGLGLLALLAWRRQARRR